MDKIDNYLVELDTKIRQLKVEYDIFFIGGKPVPPKNLRHNVQNLIQRMLDIKGMSYAQKFKFNSLVARYNSYRELWRKKTQEKEEGGILRPEQELEELRGKAPSPAPETEKENFTYVTADPTQDATTAKHFYEYMMNTQDQLGQKSIDMPFDKFFDFLQVKTTQLKQKYKCEAVEFQARIDTIDNKLKFSAKVKR